MATFSIARPSSPDPQPMLRPLPATTLTLVADVLGKAAQLIDPASGGEIFPLAHLSPYLQGRLRYIARAAVRQCHDQVVHDAELKARAAMAETVFERPFDRLSVREQRVVLYGTKAVLAAAQRHLEGTTGELLPSERAALRVPGEERIGA